MFFEQFFQQRGEEITPDDKGEVAVRCPFPHTEGFTEKKNSFFNVNKRIFGCFACRAADRGDGYSETAFIAKLYDVTYEQAIQINSLHEGRTDSDLEQTTELLLQNEEYRTYLTEVRGLTVETIRKYKLGYVGAGIQYPITLNGLVADIRTYDPNGTPKMRSEKNAKTLLFPYDEWVQEVSTTILSAGENDTLLLRQLGFNAVCGTGGEGGIPKLLLNKFKDREVVIVYDCDEAGTKGAKRMAYYLQEVGATVRIANLGLNDGEDVTDFILKYGKTKDDLQVIFDAAVPFTEDDFVEQKNKEYPLVDLWNVDKGEYKNKYISSRVSMAGQFEQTLEIPTAIEWKCRGANIESKVCQMCPFTTGDTGQWAFGQDSMRDILKVIEVHDREVDGELKRMIGLPMKCPNARINTISVQPVQKVVFSPDVETESEGSDFKQAELHSYVVGQKLNVGNKYRVFFKRVPHPKNQAIVLVVDRVEESDNSINRFKVTPEFLAASMKWQGHPDVIMKKRYEELGKPAIGNYIPENVYYATEIMFHSVLDMKFIGDLIKGHPEIIVIGDTRTGKSEISRKMANFYQIGIMSNAKTTSTAGLIGGAEHTSMGWRVKWGLIPRNNGGLVIIDEVSGLPLDTMNKLTYIRSEREAQVEKIASGTVPAKTRILLIGNPRAARDGSSKSVIEHPNGVDIVTELIGTREDISRFDLIVLVPKANKYISKYDENGNLPETPQMPEELKDIIRWVWSRTSEQVVFENNVEKYIEYIADKLNKDFGCSIDIIGHEGAKKIARMAVSVAAACFSCSDDGESIVVKQEHVDWVHKYVVSSYDNPIFRLKEFVDSERALTTVDDVIVQRVAVLMKNEPLLVSELMRHKECNINHMKLIANDQNFGKLLNTMVTAGLVQTTKNSMITATQRLRKAVNINRGTYKTQ